jgi:NitT/TauT family transport system substrate-binding protein
LRSRNSIVGRIGAAALGLLLALAGSAFADEPVKIRVGWAQAPGHMAPLLYQGPTKALMSHFGKSYIAEPVRFAGGTPQIAAMAAGELEIGAFGATAFVYAVENARMDMRIVSDVIQDGFPGHYTAPFVVRKDGGIKKAEDLKGKRVASNAIGSSSDTAMRTFLHRHGLSDNDFTTVEANFANMPAMLAESKVDMINMQPQFAHGFMDTGQYVPLFTTKDAIGTSDLVFWGARADFIAKHRAALVDFYEDYIRAIRWYLNPKNHDQAIAAAAAALKVSPESLGYAFTDADYYRSPDAKPDVPAIQRDVDDAVKLGLLKNKIELAPRYVDLSLIAEADKRITE